MSSAPGPARWLGAAALSALPLSHAWDYEAGFPGTTTLINQFNPYTGGLDLVPYYIPGTSGELIYGYQAPVRLFLLIAVAASVLVALGVGGRPAQRAALGGLIGAFVLALSDHEGPVVLTLGLALALVGGPLGEHLRAGLGHSPNRSPGHRAAGPA